MSYQFNLQIPADSYELHEGACKLVQMEAIENLLLSVQSKRSLGLLPKAPKITENRVFMAPRKATFL